MNSITHTLLCCALLVLTLKKLTEACTCIFAHPQQHFCNSDIVVRVTVIGEKLIPAKNSYDSTNQYEVKVVKTLKGYDETPVIKYLYSATESSLCGVKLQCKKDYVIGGKGTNGTYHINMCGLVQAWESLSTFQIRTLGQEEVGYHQGCDCKIKICGMESCDNIASNECIWANWQQNQSLEKDHACIKERDGHCSWYPSIADKSIYSSHP
ncbi:metalloproteinase inhibitor 4 [Leptodactylus fuscus]|uniref:metalloproteinase inhibitor 4 n=1 Tax=Leptodactylus fuscus TaxID=238119 RepID=UPI003F4E90AD